MIFQYNLIYSNLIPCQAMDAATVKYDEAMNVKLLLREICQFLDCSREGPGYTDTGYTCSSILLQYSGQVGIRKGYVLEGACLA